MQDRGTKSRIVLRAGRVGGKELMRKDLRIYNDEEMRLLADFFKEHRNEPKWWNPAFFMALITFGTGLRFREAHELRIEDCTLAPVPAVRVTTAKGGGSERTVAVLPEFRPYFEERIEFLRLHRKDDTRVEFVFPRGWAHIGTHRSINLQGPPPKASAAMQWTRKVGLAAGVQGATNMASRRSWATYLIRMKWKNSKGVLEGLTPFDLARQMGHKEFGTLIGFYDNAPAHMRFPEDRGFDWPNILREFEEQDPPNSLRYFRLAKRRRGMHEEEKAEFARQNKFERKVLARKRSAINQIG